MSSNGRVAEALSGAVGAAVTLRPSGTDEDQVLAPFRFPDGDHFVIYLRRLAEGRFEFSDGGHTFMHMSYEMDVDALFSGPRAGLLEGALGRFGIEDREGELATTTDRERLGPAFLEYVQALIQVSDLRYTTREQVRSTFLEDFRRTFEVAFQERAHFDYIDPDRDPKGEYPVDCLVNGSERPAAVFAITGDTRCREATITAMQFRAWQRPLFTVGVFEAQEDVNSRVLARFSNPTDKLFAYLGGQEDDVVEYIRERLT